jgi:hypothetical protein
VLVLLMEGTYEVRRSDELKWHGIRSKFHENLFRHLSNITVINATIRETVMLVSLIEGFYEVHR